MSDAKFFLRKNITRDEEVYAKTADSLGMDLGELRAAVLAAEGLSDKAQVRVGVIKESIVEGEKFFGSITIRERTAAE